MNDILDNLRPYFDDNEEFDEAKINELFSVFQRDFFEEPFIVNNLQVKVKRHPYNPGKDGLPEYFSHYYEKFVHITTRAIKDNKGNKCRKFCTERANRIHWIKPILINYNDRRITHFRFVESDRTVRDYFWYKGRSFIVVLEQVEPDYILITGFCVDKTNFRYYLRKEKNALK